MWRRAHNWWCTQWEAMKHWTNRLAPNKYWWRYCTVFKWRIQVASIAGVKWGDINMPTVGWMKKQANHMSTTTVRFCASATLWRKLDRTWEVHSLAILPFVFQVAFFLLFFLWFFWPPFTATVSLGWSNRPLARGCLDDWRFVCFFCGEEAQLFLMLSCGESRHDTERHPVICEVEGTSMELPKELEEEVKERSEGKEDLDWCVKDGRCSPVLGLLLGVLSCSAAKGVWVLISVLLAATSICSWSTTWVRTTNACELSCTVSVMRSVAFANFSPSSLMFLVLVFIEQAAMCTVILSSSRLSCLASSTGGISPTWRACKGLGGAVQMRGLWLRTWGGRPGWR